MLHNNRISVQYDVHDVEHAELIDAGFVLVQLTVGHSKYQFCSFIRAPQAMYHKNSSTKIRITTYTNFINTSQFSLAHLVKII